MTINIIKIGNSRGIRIPNKILQDYKMEDKLEMKIEKDRIILYTAQKPRAKWEEKMKKMARMKSVKDKPDFVENEFDKSDWEW